MNLALKMKILESQKPQIFLAHKVGIPEPYLSKIVNGWVEPKAELKEKLADALGVQVSTIFPGDSAGVSHELS